MKDKIIRIGNCLFKAIPLTLTILIVSIIISMFTSINKGMRKIYFDSLYLEITKLNGSLDINFGLTENYIPIIVTFILAFAFYFIVYPLCVNLKK